MTKGFLGASRKKNCENVAFKLLLSHLEMNPRSHTYYIYSLASWAVPAPGQGWNMHSTHRLTKGKRTGSSICLICLKYYDSSILSCKITLKLLLTTDESINKYETFLNSSYERELILLYHQRGGKNINPGHSLPKHGSGVERTMF